MLRRSAVVLAGLALAASVTVQASPASAALPGAGPIAAEPYDFNGDGTPELVVGADNLQVGSVERAGGVLVLPAHSKRLSDAQVLTQATKDVPGTPALGHRFGAAFTSADFNNDGFADLAVGAPADGVGGQDDVAGSVTVLFGSSSGLTGKGSYVLTGTGGSTDDGFGTALTAADLDGDDLPELVVGAPYTDQSNANGAGEYAAGSVTVFRGGEAHFSDSRSAVLHGVLHGSNLDDEFGSTLAVGNVDGVGGTDLVVGSRGEPFEKGDGHAGAVTICPRGTSCVQLLSNRSYAGLGSLAVGNVSGSSRPEIVFGVVHGPDADDVDGGSVLTLKLDGQGTTTSATATRLTQASRGVPGKDERNDAFGSAVAVGDLDEDGYADLIVGSPGEALGRRTAAGQVTVVYGGKNGYRTSANETYDQDTTGVPGTAEKGDRFGTAVVLSDRNGDGHLDLAVGAPGENSSGAITTIFGSGRRLTTKRARTFGLQTLGYTDRHHADFGDTLAS